MEWTENPKADTAHTGSHQVYDSTLDKVKKRYPYEKF